MSKYVNALNAAIKALYAQINAVNAQTSIDSLIELKEFVELAKVKGFAGKTPIVKTQSKKQSNLLMQCPWYARRQATEATHVLSARINSPRYDELRRAGFCEGMKFKFIRMDRIGYRAIVKHERSGRVVMFHPELLETIKPNDF